MASVFLDTYGTAAWLDHPADAVGGARWQLRAARSEGIRRVILQESAVVHDDAGPGGVDLISTAYPAPASALPSPGFGTPGFGDAHVDRSVVTRTDSSAMASGVDVVDAVLSAADEVGGIQVVIGLANSSGLWAKSQALTQTRCVVGRDAGCEPTAWMRRQVAYGEQVALEVYERARSHRSLGGWYLPLEFAPSSWATPGGLSDLVFLYGELSAFLKRLSPDLPITIAPYVDPLPSSAALPAYPGCAPFAQTVLGPRTIDPWNTPCQAQAQLRRILANSKVDEVLLQDGLGDPKPAPYVPMSLRMLRRWAVATLQAVKAASATRGEELSAGIVTDLYATDAYDISPGQLNDALRVAAGAMPATTGFCWAHLDPSMPVNAELWAAFRQVARAG